MITTAPQRGRGRPRDPRADARILAACREVVAEVGKRKRPKTGRLRSHCKNGHEYTNQNTITRSDGYRGCRTCQRAAEDRYRARLRGAA